MAVASTRLPDFVVIGTMKSGSTTLFRWLEDHPGTWLPDVKEPNFFCDDRRFRGGLDRYLELFRDAPAEKITGEASVRYTDPAVSRRTAQRLHAVLPEARLICVLRDPVGRMRSHYRHEVQRARERRSFTEAVSEVGSPYVRRSCYASALEPWLELVPSARLRVVTFEDLFLGGDIWPELLGFLGLDRRPPPAAAHNVTADKPVFTPAMRWLWDTGTFRRLPRPPALVRRRVRGLLLRTSATSASLSATADAPVPAPVLEVLAAETARLRQLIPSLRPRWGNLTAS